MKKSKYIISSKYNNDITLLYNLVNGTMIELNNKEKEIVFELLNNINNSKNSSLFEELYECGFIIDDDFDEIKEIKKRFWRNALSEDLYEFTIIPTLKCINNCIYCYEKNIDYPLFNLSSKDYDNIEKYIVKLNSKVININWYGGEPLLAKQDIINFSKKLKLIDNKKIYHSISTNMVLLDESFLNDMVSCGLKTIDTTLVGLEKMQNELRPCDVHNQFNIIINNICKAAQIIDVIGCINLCQRNINDAVNIINLLSSYKLPKFHLSFNKIVSYKNNPISDELSDDEYIRKVIELSNYALDKEMNVCDMSCFQNDGIFCGDYKSCNITVGPGSYIYKCGSKCVPENSIGIINREGKIDYREFQSKIIDPYNDKDCLNCKILPYCNGGCQSNRKNGINPCPKEKEYLGDFLNLYYKKYYL